VSARQVSDHSDRRRSYDLTPRYRPRAHRPAYTKADVARLRSATSRPPPTTSVDWGIAPGSRCEASIQAEPPSMVRPGPGALIQARRPPLGVAIENRNRDAGSPATAQTSRSGRSDDHPSACGGLVAMSPRQERPSTRSVLHDGSPCRAALGPRPFAADRQHW
jgi:hypothetical protein